MSDTNIQTVEDAVVVAMRLYSNLAEKASKTQNKADLDASWDAYNLLGFIEKVKSSGMLD